MTKGSTMIKSSPLTRATRLLKRFAKDTVGNATILVALGMPLIVGGGGFAIDFAQIYMWKRELQYANDQAAIAAAWELAADPNSTQYTDRALREYQANVMATDDFDATPSVEIANYAGGVANSVIVKSSATKMLPFTSFFTNSSTTVAVRSQAAFDGGVTFTKCLVAVDEDDSGTIKLQGDSVFTAGCGIAALSDSSKVCDSDGTNCTGEDAIIVDGNPTIDAGTIATRGTVDDWLEENTDDIILEGLTAEQLTDPFEGLEPPLSHSYTTQPDPKDQCTTYGRGRNAYTAATLNPGYYTDFQIFCDTQLNEGIYIVDGGGNPGGNVFFPGRYDVISSGRGVLFVLINGAGFTVVGSVQVGAQTYSSQLNLQGIQADYLTSVLGYDSDYANELDGMIVFEDPDSEGSNSVSLAGTSDTWLSGSLYFPVSELKIAGTAQVANRCLLIVANKVALTGTTDMTDFCPEGQEHEATVLLGSVNLVA